MECSLSTRNPCEIRGCGAAERCESSVRKCHVIRRVMKMTPAMKQRWLGFVGRNNTFNCTAADGE
jgi:hypothetical protein